MSEVSQDRRRFLTTTLIAIASVQLTIIPSTAAQSSKTTVPAIKPGTNTSFGSLKWIEPGLLNSGYAEAGPTKGPAVILLHGWP